MARKKEKDDAEKKLRRKRKAIVDFRGDAAARIQRLSERISLLNRRFFGGTNEQLQSAFKAAESVRLQIESLPSDWKPSLKGKRALIPGAIIVIRPDIKPERLESYRHMGGVERFRDATIIDAVDKFMLLIRLKNEPVTVMIPKRDAIVASVAEVRTG